MSIAAGGEPPPADCKALAPLSRKGRERRESTTSDASDDQWLTDAMMEEGRQHFRPPAKHNHHSSHEGRKTCIGVCQMDWRQVLGSKAQHHVAHAKLHAAGKPEGHSVGSLEIEIEVLPQLPQVVNLDRVTSAATSEQACCEQSAQQAIRKAQDWWHGFCERHLPAAGLHGRPVKLLALDELGQQRPVTSFVHPLQLGRALCSARAAARWVSLLRADSNDRTLPGISADDRWRYLHTVLAVGSASKAEKALLLCNLLLGFGLDAWVCFGTDKLGEHYWVLTRSSHQAATFWEPSSGVRYCPKAAADSPGCPFLTLGSVFNHERLCVNCQTSAAVADVNFRFEDQKQWRCFAPQPSHAPISNTTAFELQMTSIDSAAAEGQLEAELKLAFEAKREALLPGMGMRWDAPLSFLLMPLLVAYEQEALTGAAAHGKDEAMGAVKRCIPPGWTFRGYPHQYRSQSSAYIAAVTLKEHAVMDMLASTCNDATFALRVNMVPYPEGVVCAWVMLAVKSQEPGMSKELQML
ncbi:hypothetical protein WJX74_001322 [Apatococcus lobatus]|uniref:Centrosomal protein of 76 kDa n=1 Tax=Apatococcus lobatus TaxID=904363 RepID=A0AAW1Q4Y7_9CHLO